MNWLGVVVTSLSDDEYERESSSLLLPPSLVSPPPLLFLSYQSPIHVRFSRIISLVCVLPLITHFKWKWKGAEFRPYQKGMLSQSASPRMEYSSPLPSPSPSISHCCNGVPSIGEKRSEEEGLTPLLPSPSLPSLSYVSITFSMSILSSDSSSLLSIQTPVNPSSSTSTFSSSPPPLSRFFFFSPQLDLIHLSITRCGLSNLLSFNLIVRSWSESFLSNHYCCEQCSRVWSSII